MSLPLPSIYGQLDEHMRDDYGQRHAFPCGTVRTRRGCGLPEPGQDCEFIKGLDDPTSPAGGMVERVKRGMGDSPMAINIKDGVTELVDRFKQRGETSEIDSWIQKGPNSEINETRLEKALGSDLIDDLVKQTGLSRETLLSRLAQVLPETVDKLTPDGRVPTELGKPLPLSP